MTPVALVAYQSGLTVLVTAQEPPEEVTGAAGVLDGGCAGGASWVAELRPALVGWLVAVLAGLVVGTVLAGLAAGTVLAGLAAGAGRPESAVLACPGMACANAAAKPAVAATATAPITNDTDLIRLTRRWR
jgi:hypothetical protein